MSSKLHLYLKLYLVECPIAFVEDTCHRIKIGILNRFRKWIYNYEFKKVLEYKICDPYYGTPISNLPIGVFCPAMVVYKILEKYFGFQGCYHLNIHGIDVDTQDENEIGVTIKLYRPGLLIGRAGKDIDDVTELLENYFCKQVKIHIVEVKKDVNRVEVDYY